MTLSDTGHLFQNKGESALLCVEDILFLNNEIYMLEFVDKLINFIKFYFRPINVSFTNIRSRIFFICSATCLVENTKTLTDALLFRGYSFFLKCGYF